MKPYIVLRIAAFVVVLTEAHAHAHALPFDSRYNDVPCGGSDYSSHWAHGAIPIYLNTSSGSGVQLLAAPSGAQWGLADFEDQLQISINEFNTNIGANVRLYYAGTTSDTTVDGAIVIETDTTPSSHLAITFIDVSCVLSFPGQIRSAHIVLSRVVQSGGAVRTFSGFENGGFTSTPGLASTLNHELGHALGLVHSDPGDGAHATLLDSAGVPYLASTHIVMFSSGSPNQLHWTKYDKDAFRDAYLLRYGAMLPITSGNARGYGNIWKFFSTTSLSNIVVGVGKGTEGDAKEILGWSSISTMAGTSRTAPNNYSGSFATADWSFSAPAIAFGAGQYRLYWIESDQPVTLANGHTAKYGVDVTGKQFSDKHIKWALSSDNGLTWTNQGVLVDPTNGSQILIWTDDLSAGFDPVRSVFIVTWIDDAYNTRIMTMPTPGSPQSGNVYSVLPVRLWETPTISCSNTSNGCELVGVLHVNPVGTPISTPYIATYHGTISATGSYTILDTIFNTNMTTTQAPSLTYVPWHDAFVLAYIGPDGGSLYTSKRSSYTGTWPLPGGPIYSSSSVAVGAPSLGNWGCTTCRGHVGLAAVLYGP